MITLYQFSSSPFTEKVRRALNYKGMAFETHEVVRMTVASGNYDHVSPTRKFPTLMDGDKNVWDSTDILYYLDSISPDKPIIPSDPRMAALAHIVEDWADESLYFYEILVRAGWEHNLDSALDTFAASMPHVPREQLKPGILAAATALTQTQGVGRKPIAQVIADLGRHFASLDAMLRDKDWLIGESPSIADFAVVGQVSALLFAVEAQSALDRSENIKGWLERLDAIAPISVKGVE